MKDKSLSEAINYFVFETEQNKTDLEKINDYRNLLFLISDYATKNKEFKDYIKTPSYEKNIIINQYTNNIEFKLYMSMIKND